MRTATKAVIELLGRTDRERRRFLAVKRTQAAEIGAGFFQLHRAPDDIHHVHAVEQILLEAVTDHGVRPGEAAA